MISEVVVAKSKNHEQLKFEGVLKQQRAWYKTPTSSIYAF